MERHVCAFDSLAYPSNLNRRKTHLPDHTHHKHIQQVLQYHRFLNLQRHTIKRLQFLLPLFLGYTAGRNDARVQRSANEGGFGDERGFVFLVCQTASACVTTTGGRNKGAPLERPSREMCEDAGSSSISSPGSLFCRRTDAMVPVI